MAPPAKLARLRRTTVSRRRQTRTAGGAAGAAISRDLAAEVNADIEGAGLAQKVADVVRDIEAAENSDKPAGPKTAKAVVQLKKDIVGINAGIVARFHKAWTSGAAVAEFKKKYTSGEKADVLFENSDKAVDAKLKAVFSGKVQDVLPAFDKMFVDIGQRMQAQAVDMNAMLASLIAENEPNSLCVLRFRWYISSTITNYNIILEDLRNKRDQIKFEIRLRRLKPDDPAELLLRSSAFVIFLWVFSAVSMVVLNAWANNAIAEALGADDSSRSKDARPHMIAIKSVLNCLRYSPIYKFGTAGKTLFPPSNGY